MLPAASALIKRRLSLRNGGQVIPPRIVEMLLSIEYQKKKKKTCCSDASACLSEWKHACYRSLRRPRNKHFYDAAVLFSIFISHCCKKEVFSMLSHKRKNMISRSAFYGNSVTKQCLSLCGTNNAPLCSLLWSEPCPWKTMKAMGYVAIG